MTIDTPSVIAGPAKAWSAHSRASMGVAGALLGLLAFQGVAAAGDLLFTTRASGAQEVQEDPVMTDGSANGVFRFTRNLSKLIARVGVADLTSGVSAAHLHCAAAGQSGPVVVSLDPELDVTSGRIVDGVFTNDDISLADGEDEGLCVATCGVDINNIASLRSAADDGCLYLNVHNDPFPAGEVRGQLLD